MIGEIALGILPGYILIRRLSFILVAGGVLLFIGLEPTSLATGGFLLWWLTTKTSPVKEAVVAIGIFTLVGVAVDEHISMKRAKSRGHDTV
jgi:hypothetical protein